MKINGARNGFYRTLLMYSRCSWPDWLHISHLYYTSQDCGNQLLVGYIAVATDCMEDNSMVAHIISKQHFVTSCPGAFLLAMRNETMQDLIVPIHVQPKNVCGVNVHEEKL